MQIQAPRGLVQRPQSFRIIRVQFKELSQKPLGDLGEPGSFQTSPQIEGDFRL